MLDSVGESAKPLACARDVRHRSRVKLALGSVLALGVLLRLTGLEVHSFWYDEGCTLSIVRAPDLLAALSVDRHPPLSFLAFRGWSSLFGFGDAALRVLPALLSSCALLAFAALARLWLEPREALASAALYAFSPFLVWHAQEARMYAFLELGVVLALFGAASAVRGRRWGIVVAGIGVFLAFGSHYMGAFAAANLVALASAGRARGRMEARQAWALVVSGCMGIALWTPWLIAMLPAQLAAPWGWLARLSPRELIEFPLRQVLVEMDVVPRAFEPLGYALGALMLFGFGAHLVRVFRRQSPGDQDIVLCFGIPLLCAFAGIGLGQFFMQTKYLMAGAPATTCMIASGLAGLPRVSLRRIALVLVLLGSLGVTLLHKTANHREDYRSACLDVLDSWRAGDRIVTITATPESFAQGPLRHYLRERPDVLAGLIDSAALFPDPRTDLAPGTRLHVVYRDTPYASSQLEALRASLSLVEANPMRFRIQHLLFVRE